MKGRESSTIDFDPDNGNIDVEESVYYTRLGNIRYVDKSTGNTVGNRVHIIMTLQMQLRQRQRFYQICLKDTNMS